MGFHLMIKHEKSLRICVNLGEVTFSSKSVRGILESVRPFRKMEAADKRKCVDIVSGLMMDPLYMGYREVLNTIHLRVVSDKYGSIGDFAVGVQQMFENRRRMTSGTKRDGNDSLEEITLRSLVDKFGQRVNVALHPRQDMRR
jgi:hypothetical protein